MIRLISLVCLLPLFQPLDTAQPPPTLADFFQQRLSANANTPSLPYGELVKVGERIAGTRPSDIEAALPFISKALTRSDNDLSIQALYVLHAIAGRADAGILLRSRVSELGTLLEHRDQRLSGGSVTILGALTAANSDLIVLILIHYLSSGKPTLVHAARFPFCLPTSLMILQREKQLRTFYLATRSTLK